MPWKECSVMDERMQFVARRLAGEAMAELCREFGISRKTGYKIFDRYQECGIQGLTDRSRRPYRYANQLPFQVENFIMNVKHEHPRWGARKIRERLLRRFSGIPIPAKSTIHTVLDRHGLVERRGRVRRRAQGTSLSLGQHPHELWCTDYKGEFLLGNHKYCYPLTVTDHASNLMLCYTGLILDWRRTRQQGKLAGGCRTRARNVDRSAVPADLRGALFHQRRLRFHRV
jgi:transposase